MLETFDYSVGRLIKKIEELDWSKKTIIFFFSDNGGLEKSADQTPLRSGKANLYEGGIRVPLIVSWPGQIKPGTVNEQIVSSIDFFPTICDIAGVENTYQIDGVSLLQELRQTGSLQREAIFWHYPHYHSAGQGPCSAIRIGDFKLIEWFEKSTFGISTEGALELYNLKDDLGEQNNLVFEQSDLAIKMFQKLKAWRVSVDAQEMQRAESLK